MQINKHELDIQFIELLPERETLFFNRNWQSNFANVATYQSATAVGIINGGDVTAGNVSYAEVSQNNDN